MPQNVPLKIFERNIFKCFFPPNFYWILIGKYLGIFCCSFRVWLRQKNGFCVLVDVNEMAQNREVLCKQYPSTEKNIQVSKQFMAFLRTLVIALFIHVRIMCIAVAQGRYDFFH